MIGTNCLRFASAHPRVPQPGITQKTQQALLCELHFRGNRRVKVFRTLENRGSGLLRFLTPRNSKPSLLFILSNAASTSSLDGTSYAGS